MDHNHIELSGGNDTLPTHRCLICGAFWRYWELVEGKGHWNLRSRDCGTCCDNEPMGYQIRPATLDDVMHFWEDEDRIEKPEMPMPKANIGDANLYAEADVIRLVDELNLVRALKKDYQRRLLNIQRWCV